MGKQNQITNNPEPVSIFIVHGHDEQALLQVKEFLQELNLKPIVLSEQPKGGKTIIEKIEEYQTVSYAIILYTPCDEGKAIKRERKYKKRARQNVVFEHGYFTGKLGRNRVAVLVKPEVEKPSDIDGVLYISMGMNNHWKNELKRELKASSLITEE
ncbi:MAG: TIR domain-containing protein [Christensenellales bacterium]|jgi:predicted nucleotide-binding protein